MMMVWRVRSAAMILNAYVCNACVATGLEMGAILGATHLDARHGALSRGKRVAEKHERGLLLLRTARGTRTHLYDCIMTGGYGVGVRVGGCD